MHSLQRRRDRLQDDVASRVAVHIVDPLEVVDVDHQHQRRLAGAGDAVDLAGERQLEVTAVGQAGERIAARDLAQPVDERLQPRVGADRMLLGKHLTRLLQQLQRPIEAERLGIAERRVDFWVHEEAV